MTEPERAVSRQRRDWKPSARDQSIYELHEIQGQTIRRVAEQFGLSHVRILQICKRLHAWVTDQFLADVRQHRVRSVQRLRHVGDEALRAWEGNKRPTIRTKTGGVVRAKDGTTTEADPEVTTTTSSGDPRHLQVAIDAEMQVARLLGLDAPRKHALTDPTGQLPAELRITVENLTAAERMALAETSRIIDAQARLIDG